MKPFHKLRKVPVRGQLIRVVSNGHVYEGTFDSMSAANNGRFTISVYDRLMSFAGTDLVQVLEHSYNPKHEST